MGLGTRFGLKVRPVAGTRVVVVEGKVEASTDEGEVEVESGREVLLTRRTSRPGPVRRAGDLESRFAWAHALGEKGFATGGGAEAGVAGGPVVLYRFDEGGGAVVHDSSGVGEPLHLRIRDMSQTRWLRGGGLAVTAPTMAASDGPATKIIDACRATNEITIEVWAEPAHTRVEQPGPVRIVTISGNTGERDFTFGMHRVGTSDAFFVTRLRTTETDDNGYPCPYSRPGSARARLCHVVYTRDASGVNRFYVDGRRQEGGLLNHPERLLSMRRGLDTVGGDFSNWHEGFRLALANEITGDRPWLGAFYYVAIYSRALTWDEIRRNHAAASGRR